MYNITDEQIDFILEDIEKKGIKTEDVRLNLLDHICCIIEQEMPEEKNFYRYYEDTLKNFFRNDLSEIEEETQHLLKFKNYYIMKTTLKISGFTSAGLILLGAIFKTLHFPGAAILIVVGCLLFALAFLPMMIALKFRDDDKKVDKWVMAFGFLMGSAAAMGVLFKLMRWPLANVLMVSSTTGFVFLYVPLFFLTRFNRPDQKFNTMVNSVLMMVGGGMLYALMNLGYSNTNVTGSVNASYVFMNNNAKNLMQANSGLLKNKDDEFHKLTTSVYNKIEETKVHLIANVEGISLEKAKTYNIASMKNHNESTKTKEYFVNETGEFGLENLLTEVEKYNNYVKQKFPKNKERIVAIDNLQLKNTVASVVLHELSQIQLQIASSENAYVNSL